MPRPLSRRSLLQQGLALGCSAAASPILTPVSFAAAPWDTRLVVILLRGGMDGLDVVQPYGDPSYRNTRQTLLGGPEAGALDLDGYFAMNAALAPLKPLWDTEDLGFVQATSTPYRDKRSHFDGQDLLEAGTASLAGVRDGWLNRMMQLSSGVATETAYALGQIEMKVLMGQAPYSVWSPDSAFDMSPQAIKLAELIMAEDPAFKAAFSEAQRLSDVDVAITEATGDEKRVAHIEIADFAADRLRHDARIATFSMIGWDTHAGQSFNISRALERLANTILRLKDGLTPSIWSKTVILTVTEFGRTVHENGNKGTDHGTGGLMMLAGGAISGGQVFGRWPGLAEADLYDRRDLMPTSDVRAHIAWVMHGMLGVSQSDLETSVFPGLDMGNNLGLLL